MDEWIKNSYLTGDFKTELISHFPIRCQSLVLFLSVQFYLPFCFLITLRKFPILLSNTTLGVKCLQIKQTFIGTC